MFSREQWIAPATVSRSYGEDQPVRGPGTAELLCDPASVADPLNLRPGLLPGELHRLRRAYALANHPDRVSPWERDAATRRMSIANALIDEALCARHAATAP
jgi:hypothetical protein